MPAGGVQGYIWVRTTIVALIPLARGLETNHFFGAPERH